MRDNIPQKQAATFFLNIFEKTQHEFQQIKTQVSIQKQLNYETTSKTRQRTICYKSGKSRFIIRFGKIGRMMFRNTAGFGHLRGIARYGH